MESQKYCVWCGNAYDHSLTVCPSCHKNPDPKENQLADWLYSHTKDKLKGDIEGTLYNKLKNWALSNLYSMVLGVTVVTTAVTVASAADNGHIQPVTRPPAALNSQEEPTPVVNGDAMDYTQLMLDDYRMGLMTCGGDSMMFYDFWLPPEYGITGLHHAFDDFWDGQEYDTSGVVKTMSAPSYGSFAPAEPQTIVAQQLLNRGYEIFVLQWSHHMFLTEDAVKSDYRPTYLVTFTNIDGTWYIAEELNIFDRYDETSQQMII